MLWQDLTKSNRSKALKRKTKRPSEIEAYCFCSFVAKIAWMQAAKEARQKNNKCAEPPDQGALAKREACACTHRHFHN